MCPQWFAVPRAPSPTWVTVFTEVLFQKVLFPTPMLSDLESWAPFLQTDSTEKDLGIMSKMIWNLTLINPYLLEGWDFPFLKKADKPHFFLEVQISWKANCKIILFVQTPGHSAPSWLSADMKMQKINTIKINRRTCCDRVNFAGPNPLRSFFVPRDILCFTRLKSHHISKWNFAGHWSRMWASSFGYFGKSETTYLFHLEKLLPSKAVSQETFMTA